MTYSWYVIANLDEFISKELVSISLPFIFPVIGRKTVNIFSGNCYSVMIDGVFLPLNLNDVNPFEFEDFAVYLDSNNDIWLGIAAE